MESGLSCEYKTLTEELAHGMEKAKQLRLQLCSTSPSQAEHLLLQRILSTFEKALFILNRSGFSGQVQMGAPESSMSVEGSAISDDMSKNFSDHCSHGDTPKKRKLQPTWTEQVRANSKIGLEGPADDGYSWRKYGQKDILGAKYPRSYYRCTYRQVRNCWATKQVQRSDEDPTIFEVTYKGTHTCPNVVPPPASPEKQELKLKHQLEQQNQTLLNLKANLRVNTEVLGNNEMSLPAHFSCPSTFACQDRDNYYSPISALADENQIGAYSPLFYSSATSESNYFSTTTIHQIENCGASNDFEHIISAHASITNSPIGRIEFSTDPNFLFNDSGFFP